MNRLNSLSGDNTILGPWDFTATIKGMGGMVRKSPFKEPSDGWVKGYEAEKLPRSQSDWEREVKDAQAGMQVCPIIPKSRVAWHLAQAPFLSLIHI